MFRDFKVGELFDCSTTKGYNPNKGDLPNGNTPYVTRSAFNNGISGYFTDDSGFFMNDGNCITIGAEGGIAFYQPDGFIAGIKVYTLRHERMTCEIGMYLCSALNTYSHVYSYTNARILDKIKAETIQLPVKPNTDPLNYTQDDIDWDYMESTIRELEESTIRELDAYLKETGLNDYHLTDAEHALLDREPMFCAFSVTTVFDVINTKSIRKSDIQEQLQSNDGSIPYITASDKNNAVAAYIECPQEWIDKGNCIFIGGKTTTITYQLQDFCSNDSHNLALYLKNEQARTERIQLYLVSILKKAFANKYQWSNALSKTRIKAETIQLPVKLGTDSSNYTQDDIDWDYMESYNRVMEKRVIADVVDYKNEVIALTEECVSDN